MNSKLVPAVLVLVCLGLGGFLKRTRLLDTESPRTFNLRWTAAAGAIGAAISRRLASAQAHFTVGPC